MDLVDYLKAEGVIDYSNLSNEKLMGLATNLELVSEYEEKLDIFCDENTIENIITYYDFMNRSGFRELFDGMLYDRTINESPKILENITGRALDIGCGTGLKTVYYALNNPESDFMAVDISELSLEIARKRAEKYGLKNINFKCANSMDLPFEDEFDTVISEHNLFETQSRYQDPMFDEKFKQIAKVMRLTGKFVGVQGVGEAYSTMSYFQMFANGANLELEQSIIKFVKFGDINMSVMMFGHKYS